MDRNLDKRQTLFSLGPAKIRYISSFNLANRLFGNDLSNIDTSKIRGQNNQIADQLSDTLESIYKLIDRVQNPVEKQNFQTFFA